ncbi:hypothetical protein ACVCAH_25905 [Micromonospora sp. LZ34]
MARLVDEGDDPYLWLEDLDGADAAGWARDCNAETVAALTGSEAFAGLQAEIRQVLDAEDRIPWPGWRGDPFYYNFWKDATHPRGVWRRTTLDQYRRPDLEWDVLLDVDALAAEEGENWVWQDVTVLRPGYQRCLISLCRGGSDAVVVREHDLGRRAFDKGRLYAARGQEPYLLDRPRPHPANRSAAPASTAAVTATSSTRSHRSFWAFTCPRLAPALGCGPSACEPPVTTGTDGWRSRRVRPAGRLSVPRVHPAIRSDGV